MREIDITALCRPFRTALRSIDLLRTGAQLAFVCVSLWLAWTLISSVWLGGQAIGVTTMLAILAAIIGFLLATSVLVLKAASILTLAAAGVCLTIFAIKYGFVVSGPDRYWTPALFAAPLGMILAFYAVRAWSAFTRPLSGLGMSYALATKLYDARSRAYERKPVWIALPRLLLSLASIIAGLLALLPAGLHVRAATIIDHCFTQRDRGSGQQC